MKILIINGPNLNLLGQREPSIYGTESLSEIMEWLKEQPTARKHDIHWFQSNSEGEIINCIHSAIDEKDGIVINPGALTHYSYALRDALTAAGIPAVEVHLSDLGNREDFRKISVIKDVCLSQVTGLGKHSYLEGLKIILKHLE
ncbi:MAG: type II 3-dehydroquinate dehydratase [Candidatus Neomarinimicrobiota bacterium]